ncbi:MAG: PDZ domain-containing protein [Opitutaceae bacterium]|jgi:serine protease Do|nr:PDZ domain-containing protein [Opitutaceae bacterium]
MKHSSAKYSPTLAAICGFVNAVAAAPVADLLEERLSSVVVVEFAIEHELDRTVNYTNGIVIDDDGTVILESSAISDRATPDQLVDFKIYRPGNPTTQYATADYVGQDGYTTWHFVKVRPEGRNGLRPITDFAAADPAAVPAMGEHLWGIGLRQKDEEFAPYFLSSQVSLIQRLPQLTGIALSSIAGRGCPIFNEAGEFIGVGASGFGQRMMIYSQRRRGEMSVLINPDEAAGFRLAAEVYPAIGRIPDNPYGRPLPWFGIDGLDPVGPEVAEFLGLGSTTGLVISELLSGSPAEQGGLLPRDIIIALDGVPFPRLKPDTVVAAHLMREVLKREPGGTMTLTVMRDRVELELPIELGEAPRTPKEADRNYFEELGITVRETVFSDVVARREDPSNLIGVIAHFIKPSSPAGTAGLRVDDWVKEIDGVGVETYEQALELFAEAEASGRPEVVMLVSRGGKTSVMRVKVDS